MKKSLFFVWALVGLMAVGPAIAAPVAKRLTDLETAANRGATHVVRVDYSHFSDATATNTTYTSAIPVSAKSGVLLSHMILRTAFDAPAYTNGQTSVAVKVGDAGDDDRYLASTELASDGTEVWGAFGRTVWNSGQTNNVTLSYAPIFYTSSTNINLIFTPHSSEMLSSNTVGEVDFFFTILKAP